MANNPSTVPPAIHDALARLGADLSATRRRRRIPLFRIAQRAGTTRQTISRIERGDPSVAMGTWAAVLLDLKLLHRLTELGAPANDFEFRFLEKQHLLQRVGVRWRERWREP